MAAFGIPDEERQEHWKVDGWRTLLEQASTLEQVIELECDLSRRVAWAARRSYPMPFAPALRVLVMHRWNEIAQGMGITLRRKS